MFEFSGGLWAQTQKLSSPTPANWSAYGLSLGLDDTLLAIGAQGEGPQQQGQMHVYRLTPTGWLLQSTIPSVATENTPGFFVRGLEGDLILAGSSHFDGAFENQGALLAYSASNQGCPTLLGSPSALSLAQGGTQHLFLDGGPVQSFSPYVLLGTLSGTFPGQSVDGLNLPLNPDAYFLASLGGKAPLQSGAGLLDATGRAKAELKLPAGLPTALAGMTIHHAFLTIQFSGPIPFVGFTSAAEPVVLAP